MKVTTVLKMTLQVMLACGTCQALAGGMEGGGGKTVICRNADNSIRSAEVLDLYEARTVYNLPYSEASQDWRVQGETILNKAGIPVMVSSPPSDIYTWYASIGAHLVLLPAGTVLKPIDDSLEVIVPRGCRLEQAVNYQNDQRILVDGEIWAALSQTQKAALMIHEATYRLLRSTGETDSRRARHLTAHIVSGRSIAPTYPGNIWKRLCSGGDKKSFSAFYVVDDGASDKYKVYFASFGGRLLMSRAVTEVPKEIFAASSSEGWAAYMQARLASSFEAGDVFNLSVRNVKGEWTVRLEGLSAVDASIVGPIEMTCIRGLD